MSWSTFLWRPLRRVILALLAGLVLGAPSARATTVEPLDLLAGHRRRGTHRRRHRVRYHRDLGCPAGDALDGGDLLGYRGLERGGRRGVDAAVPGRCDPRRRDASSLPGCRSSPWGDRAVVFSAGNGTQACPLVGWWQGLYRLFYDAGQDAFTVADHAGQPVVGIEGGAGQLESRMSSADNDDETMVDALTLDDFRSVVRAAIP